MLLKHDNVVFLSRCFMNVSGIVPFMYEWSRTNLDFHMMNRCSNFTWGFQVDTVYFVFSTVFSLYRVPTGPYFREKSLFSIVALPALEKSLLLNIFDRSPGKVLIFNRCVKTWMINIVLRKLRFSKCCGNDVELFGNPSDPLTNHRWRVVWRHLVPAKIPRASFIKFYYVVTLSQSADTWCHVVVVRNLIGPQSRRYTWRTLRKTPSIFVEIRQHT